MAANAFVPYNEFLDVNGGKLPGFQRLEFSIVRGFMAWELHCRFSFRLLNSYGLLDPFVWNRTALKHVSYSDGPLTTGDDDLNGYAPGSAATGNFPVALFGAHNSPRIVAQQGVFTIFGAHMKSMESLITSGRFPQVALTAIIVDAMRVRSMSQSLLDQGITETVVFPDLEGLAKETRRFFGFEG